MLNFSKRSNEAAESAAKVLDLESKLAACEAANAKAQQALRCVKELDSKVAAINRSQAVIEFNLDGTICGANENFLGAMGYAAGEVVGRHHSMFVDREYASSAEYRAFWDRLNRGEFIADKFRRLARGGREIWIQASYNPLFDESGKAYRVIKFATDVTAVEHERRRSEDERGRNAAAQEQVVSGLAEGLKQLAEGNLAYRLQEAFAADYEQLRGNFNNAIGKLQAKVQDALTGVNQNADAIRSGAADLSRAADELSHRTEEQAASLEETAAALSGITETVHKAAESAKLASSTVATARGEAEHSGEIVHRAVSAMQQIEESSRKVSQIIGVIDEIAFQTNLLALNAGVEAARAGDAGRGFAVVASEVRALAQRAAEAAKEIKGLISTSSQHVDSGSKLVNETGQALGRIVQRVNEINALIVGIAGGAQEQAASLNQVNAAISQMDQATQQNAAMVEESTAAIHSLAKEADGMVALMAKFELGQPPADPIRSELQRAAPHAFHPPKANKPNVQIGVGRQRAQAGEPFVAPTRPARAASGGGRDDWQEF